MEISQKHLKMIAFAIDRWIEDLDERAADLPEELQELHLNERKEYIKLRDMVQDVILSSNERSMFHQKRD